MADILIRRIYASSPKTLRRAGTNADYAGGGGANLFLIANGCINVRGLYAICIVASTGNVREILNFTPTLGVVGLTPICTFAAAAVTTIGSLLSWSGLLAGVMTRHPAGWTEATGADTGFLAGQSINFSPGVIRESAALADATLVMDWYICYIPGDPSVSVTVM